MRIPKNLFWNGVPINTKYIMAQNGYATLPEVDTSNYHPVQQDDVQASVWNPGQYDVTGAKRSNPYDTQVDTSNYQQPDVYQNLQQAPTSNTVPPAMPPPKPIKHNPNTPGDYINLGLGIADTLIPGERVHRNNVTQPLPVYNPHPYGTGSQAIMEDGGEVMAKDGHWIQKAINPKHKGYCTPMTKSTCTPHRKALAKTFKKHHGFHKGEDGIELPVYNPGGDLSPEKAAEILHDGTAHGHKLTDKQRRFMGWKAGQKAPDGTQLPPNTQLPSKELATPQSRGDAYMVDAINQTLVTGQRPKNTNGYSTPQEQQILNDAYIWRQANDRKNPQANIEGYFNRPVDQNNPLHMYRARLNTIGHGASSMYNTTPNLDVQQPQPAIPASVATLEHGGYVEGSVHDLSEEEIAKLLKAGHKIEYLD